MVVALPLFAYVFTIIVFLFFILYLFKTNNGLPRNYPFIGMLGFLIVNFNCLYDVALDVLSKSKGTFLIKGFWFTNTDLLVTSDPKNIHYITTTKFSNYPKGSASKDIFDILGICIFNIDFDEWTFRRKAIHAYFKDSQFHKFLNKVIVENVNNELIPVLKHVASQGMVVDFHDVLNRHLLDAAWMFCTGYELKTLTVNFSENPFGKAFDDACQAMYYRNIFPPLIWKPQSWLGIGLEKKLHDAKRTVQEMIQNCVLKKKEDLVREEAANKESESEESFDILKRYFLGPLEAGQKPYPEDLVRDDILGIIFAAYDTTSTALAWLFQLLSENPHVEAKIRHEIETCIDHASSRGRKWKVETKDELSKLVYMQASICEALRLYPPVPFQHRTSVKADVLPSGHRVAPRTRVVMSGYCTGRMASIWGENCLEFKPERWIDRNGNIKYEASSTFYTFHAGPRICPGKDIAFTLMKAAVASIIYNFHVEVVETAPIIAKPSIILAMKHGMRVRVKTLV